MSKRSYKITCESSIRFTVFFTHKDNDKFMFTSSSLEDLVNLIKDYTKQKVRLVQSDDGCFIEKC